MRFVIVVAAAVAWGGICQAIGVPTIPLIAGGAEIGWVFGRLV